MVLIRSITGEGTPGEDQEPQTSYHAASNGKRPSSTPQSTPSKRARGGGSRREPSRKPIADLIEQSSPAAVIPRLPSQHERHARTAAQVRTNLSELELCIHQAQQLVELNAVLLKDAAVYDSGIMRSLKAVKDSLASSVRGVARQLSNAPVRLWAGGQGQEQAAGAAGVAEGAAAGGAAGPGAAGRGAGRAAGAAAVPVVHGMPASGRGQAEQQQAQQQQGAAAALQPHQQQAQRQQRQQQGPGLAQQHMLQRGTSPARLAAARQAQHRTPAAPPAVVPATSPGSARRRTPAAAAAAGAAAGAVPAAAQQQRARAPAPAANQVAAPAAGVASRLASSPAAGRVLSAGSSPAAAAGAAGRRTSPQAAAGADGTVVCNICRAPRAASDMVQNSAVYRTCRACLLDAVQGRPLPHCPRAACSATDVRLRNGASKCHKSGGSLEQHYVVIENGLFTVKFKKKAKRGPRRQQQGGAAAGAAGAAAAAGQL